ncbi:MAG: phosphonate C-P lyase system protein PhnG [Pseudomonadota bacterium]
MTTDMTEAQADRRYWMSVLAKADSRELSVAWDRLDEPPEHDWIRRPETGMTMVRGRAGGSGEPFNLGEMTVTRCAVNVGDGIMGVAYVRGRDHRHCELAALFDALMQDPRRHDEIDKSVIRPLARAQDERKREARNKTAATRVDFFTMATGRDGS